MSRLPIAIVLAFAVALAMSGCGGGGGERDPAAQKPRTARASADSPAKKTPHDARRAKPGTTVRLNESDYGSVLFGGNRAIYLFDRETSPRSECYGACAEAWPPVLTEGRPRAAAGVRSDLLGTVTRRDGSKQVAYNDHPLYYYVNDAPGQVGCQNVTEFGGLWLVVDRDGDAVR